MAWGLRGADRPDEQEGRRVQWEKGNSREWTILVGLAISRNEF